LILRRPIVWYNLHVKMILATVAMCMCGSVVFAGPVAVHSNLPPDTEFETNIVAEAWSEFDRVLGVRTCGSRGVECHNASYNGAICRRWIVGRMADCKAKDAT